MPDYETVQRPRDDHVGVNLKQDAVNLSERIRGDAHYLPIHPSLNELHRDAVRPQGYVERQVCQGQITLRV